MDELTELFDNMKMPEDCAQRIEHALETGGGDKEEWTVMKKPASGRNFGWLAAAACLVLAAVAGVFVLRGGDGQIAATAPTADTETIETLERIRKAEQEIDDLEREKERLREIIEGKNIVCEALELRDGRAYLTYNGQEFDITDGAPEELLSEEMAAAKADFEDGLRYTEGNITYIYSGDGGSTLYDTSLHTPFTEWVDGRVFFTANGEYLDITEEFSEEEPFTYIFTDRHFLIHYIAIGGTAENPGHLEMVYTAWDSGLTDFVSGGGINTWNKETEERYGWEQRAKEIFEPYGVYWVS